MNEIETRASCNRFSNEVFFQSTIRAESCFKNYILMDEAHRRETNKHPFFIWSLKVSISLTWLHDFWPGNKYHIWSEPFTEENIFNWFSWKVKFQTKKIRTYWMNKAHELFSLKIGSFILGGTPSWQCTSWFIHLLKPKYLLENWSLAWRAQCIYFEPPLIKAFHC